MKQGPHRGNRRIDADGVRIKHHERTSLARSVLLIAAAVTVGLATLLVLRTFDRPARAPRRDPVGRASIDPPPASVPRAPRLPKRVDAPTPQERGRTAVRRRTKARASGKRPQAEREVTAAEKGRREIDARDYIAVLRASGETKGLAAFPPPGTRPPRTGVIVPDNYVLPEGFARHYQATDDGRRLAPILTLQPEYELIDYAGNPVALTDDRIVPPEFAPPDLEVKMLEIPDKDDRRRSDR